MTQLGISARLVEREALGESYATAQFIEGLCRSSSSVNHEREATMKMNSLIGLAISTSIVVSVAGAAISAQDKYTVQVPDGLAFSEFRGYEDWPVIALSG